MINGQAGALQAAQQQASGLGQQQSGLNSLGSLSWNWPYQYQYWQYPYLTYPPRVLDADCQKLMDTYKRNFGKDWKRIWAQTVRFEVR